MADEVEKKSKAAHPPLSPGSLRRHTWKRFLRGPDPSLLEDLYIPALGEAIQYDRCCSYFSSSVLAAAARGFGRLIERLESMGEKAARPSVRLIVNEELAEEDVRAMMETGDTSKLESLLKKRLKSPKEMLEKRRLAMLGWMVKRGFLEVRVGVMRRGQGIVHAKFGIVRDEAGDALVFSGSGNQSSQGILSNYERLEVSTSWEDAERYEEYAQEIEALWKDRHPDVYTLTLPEAMRLRLIKFAPKEPPIVEPSDALARQKAAMIWKYIVEVPYMTKGGVACDATSMVDLWPHQKKVVEEAAEAWPDGRLLCDEVGMGKTIETILILRRLMAGRGVKRALLLLPAGLLKQWQGELREKGGMVYPRLEGINTLIWPDDSSKRVSGLSEALEEDVLLLSRETARTENNIPLLLAATPWDLVILDESHAARRRKQEEGEFNSGTLLLNLLRQLQLRRQTRGFFLLSATPMQTHPWEPWDLMAVLGEGGHWLSDFANERDYYRALHALENGLCDIETARKAARMIAADPDFPPSVDKGINLRGVSSVSKNLAFVAPTKRVEKAGWLRHGSPLARRMYRNTKETLRRYYEKGLLPDPPPRRLVTDISFDYAEQAERRVYNHITRYIEKRFEELEQEKPGKGFVMTIYRRRASSSPLALERSLERRREGLMRVIERKAYDVELTISDVPEALSIDDLPDEEAAITIPSSLPSDPQVARLELQELESALEELRRLMGLDTKRDRFFQLLREISEDGRRVLVFTEYTDTMDYIRENLVSHYGKGLACYSGGGGEVWDGEKWKPVTKDAVTRALRDEELRAVICTDAASEGLNLQAAGALVNYDLPWNPSKVEQRIGRIDRIGQKLPEVRIVNLFLKDSVDDKVYGALKARCGLFEHFVGPMQPVLAKARRMLLGQEQVDILGLDSTASDVESDQLTTEMYMEREALGEEPAPALLSRTDLETALSELKGEFGVRATQQKGSAVYKIAGGGLGKLAFAARIEALEKDSSISPLTPTHPLFRKLAEKLAHAGECLPLVVASCQSGGFRRSMAYWVGADENAVIDSIHDLRRRIEMWNGDYPEKDQWLAVEKKAQRLVEKEVRLLEQRAMKREEEALKRQLLAARLRLERELGRYLACVDEEREDFNEILLRQLTRDIASANRLKACLKKLGGYPEWSPELYWESKAFVQHLSANQRKARLLGNEIDAALEDPRWLARVKSRLS